MIDLSPLLTYLVEIATAALATAGAYFVHQFAKRIGMDLDDGAADTVERYIGMAVDAVAGRIDPQRNLTDNDSIAEIVDWIAEHAPKALKRANLDAESIEGMVRQRLNG